MMVTITRAPWTASTVTPRLLLASVSFMALRMATCESASGCEPATICAVTTTLPASTYSVTAVLAIPKVVATLAPNASASNSDTEPATVTV